MNNEIKKEKFIEGRIRGETFDSIAKELKVSKQTLINWNKEREIKELINIAEVTKFQSIIKEYQQERFSRIEYLCDLSRKLKNELLNRDFSKIRDDKLFQMIISCDSKISEELPKKDFKDPESFELICGSDNYYLLIFSIIVNILEPNSFGHIEISKDFACFIA